MSRAALKRPGVIAVYTAEDLGRLLAARPAAGAAAADLRASSSTRAPMCRSPKTRSAVPASRSRSWSRKAAISPRTRSTISTVDLEILPAVVDLEQALAKRLGAAFTTISATMSPPMCVRPRAITRSAAAKAASHAQAPLSLRARHLLADRDPRRGGAMGRARRADDGLGHHAGAGVRAQRARRRARPRRRPGAGDRAVRRRRLRAEDHDALSGRGDAAVDLDAAQPPDQMDRGPLRAFCRDHA